MKRRWGTGCSKSFRQTETDVSRNVSGARKEHYRKNDEWLV
jgi:hypothetical protein